MKHKMWSRLLSMVLAVMMITSIVPTSAFAEAASEIAASSQAVAEVVEQTEEVTLPEDTTTEEPAAETPAQEPAAETPAEEPAGEPVPTAEPVAEPTAEPATENEQPTAEPTQAPAETAVPSEQPSAEPTAAPEGTETPEATAVPSATPAPSESPLPSESPVPSETPVPTETPEATEEPVAMNEEAYETTADVENADITVTVNVPAGALPVDAELKADLIAEETEEFAQAQAALDEQQVEYDGMIALDIRFELNGEEIEPLYPVEVTIDAKAMLPENVDPETVTVQHLKEDESGEVVAVETVADATEETGDVTVAATQTEEAAMDMASTFAVDGFSTFTVAYGLLAAPRANNGVSLRLVYSEEDEEDEEETFGVQLKDEAGQTLVLEENTTITVEFKKEDKTIKFSDMVVGDKRVTSDGKIIGLVTGTSIKTIEINGVKYEYDRAIDPNNNTAEGVQYQGNNTWKYKIADNNFRNLENNTITFVYEKQASTERPDFAPIQTVDTNAKGIDLKLFNYNAQINGGSKSDEVSDDRALTFKNDGKGVDGTNKKKKGDKPVGWLEADQYPVKSYPSGIVQEELGDDGFPVTSEESVDGGRSIGYLFGKKDCGIYTDAVTEYPANYLFTYDPNTGYYEYDSAKNAANYDENQKRFYVYDYKEAANTKSGRDNDGSFLPFNNAQAVDVEGSWSDRKFLFDENTVDYWFGMSMTAEFIQPKDGKVNDQDMVFEFTGDDDVWVFIDGKLVLDLGGVHGAVSGSINFATGQVIADDEVDAKHSFAPFDDYSKHTIEYFYLERGGDVANCHIRFNLPTIPTEDFAVAKQLTGTNETITNESDFTFKLINGTTNNPETSVPFKVYNLNDWTQSPSTAVSTRSDHTSSEGIFVLGPNEVAVFEGKITAGGGSNQYRVQEVTEDIEEYLENVYINNQPAGVSNPSAEVGVGSNFLVFNNWAKNTNTYNLTLTKEWTTDEDEFAGTVPFGKVEVLVQQYYKVTSGSTTNDRELNRYKITLTPNNGWSGSYAGQVYDYSVFRALEETVYSVNGQKMVVYTYDVETESWSTKYQNGYTEADLLGWHVGDFTFTRDYGTAEISDLVKVPEKNNQKFILPGNGLVVLNKANQYRIWMPYMEYLNEAARTAIKNSLNDEYGGVIFLDEDSGSTLGNAVINYQSDGTIYLDFTGQNYWSMFFYGPVVFTNQMVSASMTNVLDTDFETKVDVEKVWDDDADSSKRPGSITVELLKNGESFTPAKQLILNASSWKGSFTNLDKYNDDGTLIQYTVKEVEVEGYKATINGDMQTGFVITNTPIDVTGKLKIFKDIDDKVLGGGKDVFNFRIDKMDGATVEKTWYMHVDGKGYAYVNGTEQSDAEKFIELPAGDYTVTELDNINYTFKDVSATKDGQNTGTVNKENHSITVKVGDDEITQVTFTNTPEPTNVPSDGSAVINGMQKNDDNKFTLTFEQKKELGQTVSQTTTSN
ncbi:Cna B-type domain-containing protein [Allofournierella massiliensis]|uniref:Fibro-slime domain-containing protein n=1 Tax=Allofournierella massiliensis TaxID=1650663 RepID=A0A4R1R5N6_9FIRM|nr:Cna B-type domain-containing protein [Fournierella massiliensis]TCL60835.1 fibro-slime domain-containing protein [Fournierella massiliensis]